MNKGNFIIQEEKPMKGLTNIGIVREFCPKENVRETIDFLIAEEEERCIVGRDSELMIFQKEISDFMSDSLANKQHNLIVISGEAGVGRTRLLDSFVVMGLKRHIKLCSTRLTLQDADTTLKAITNLLAIICKLDYDSTHQARETKIKKYFKNDKLKQHLYLLNQILNVNFPVTTEEVDTSVILSKLISELLGEYSALKGRVIFTIDDAHLIDKDTWQFLPLFTREHKTLVVITMRSPIATKNIDALRLINNLETLRVPLGGLKKQHMSALACQFLNVSMIPLRLDTMLRQKSMGVPLWVELLLKEYMNLNVVRTEPDSVGYHIESMVAPAPRYLIDPKPKKVTDLDKHVTEEEGTDVAEYGRTSFEDQLISGTQVSAATICVFVPNKEIDIGIPGSVKGMIQARIDRLEESDQLILKTASVLINMQFFRRMLEHILPTTMNEEKIVESFQRLAEAGFFKCGTKEGNMSNPNFVATLRVNPGMQEVAMCSCMDRDGKKDDKPMGVCRYLSFQSTSIRVTAYEMLMENNRRPLHKSAAAFIETQARNCLQQNDQCNKDQMFLSFFYDDLDNSDTQSVQSHPPIPKDFHRPISSKGKSTGFQLSVISSEPRLSDTKNKVNQPPNTNEKHKELKIVSINDEAHKDGILEGVKRISRNINSKSLLQSFAIEPLDESEVSIDDSHAKRRVTKFHQDSAKSKTGLRSINLSKRQTLVLKQRSMNISQSDERRGSMALATVFGTNMKLILLREATPEDPGENGLEANVQSWQSLKAVSWLYPQMIDHFKGAGMTKNAVSYYLEAAAANVALFDFKTGFEQLKSIREIHQNLKSDTNPFPDCVSSIDSYHLTEIEESQMECLIGRCLARMDDGINAMAHFRRSLSIIGFTFPQSQFKIKLTTRRQQFIQYKHLTKPDKYLCTANDMASRRCIQRAECMQYVFEYSLIRKDYIMARFSALVQLNSAEEVNNYPRVLLVAYTCMIQLSELNNYRNFKTAYEVKYLLYDVNHLLNE